MGCENRGLGKRDIYTAWGAEFLRSKMVRRIRGWLSTVILIWILAACGEPQTEQEQSAAVQPGFVQFGQEDGRTVWDTDPQAPGGSAAGENPGDDAGQEDLWQYLRQATVQISGPQYMGSGVVWSADEERLVIATAAHVAWDNSPMTALFDRGEPVEARTLHISDRVDVAFLEVSLREAEERGAVWQEARQDKESCERLEAGQALWIPGAVEDAGHDIPGGSVVDPWIYMEDFENYMLLGYACVVPGASGSGVFTREGILAGILCGGNEADQIAVLPWSVMEANRE